MGWLVAIVAVAVLMMVPVGIRAAYNPSGAKVSLIVGPVRVILHPGKKKASNSKGQAKNNSRKDDFESQKSLTPEKKGSLKDSFPIVRLIVDFLADFRRKLRINNLGLKLILGSCDPADLAVNYGRAWTVLGNLMPLLERSFIIKKRNLEVECDFTSIETMVDARIDMTVTVGRILALLLHHGTRILRKYLKILKQLKGGVTT